MPSYNSMKTKLGNESIRFSTPVISSSGIDSASGSFLSNSPLISHHNSTDYNKYLLSQTNAFPPGEPILSSTVWDRLSSSTPTQTFQTKAPNGMGQSHPIPWDTFEKTVIPWDGMGLWPNPVGWDGIMV